EDPVRAERAELAGSGRRAEELGRQFGSGQRNPRLLAGRIDEGRQKGRSGRGVFEEPSGHAPPGLAVRGQPPGGLAAAGAPVQVGGQGGPLGLGGRAVEQGSQVARVGTSRRRTHRSPPLGRYSSCSRRTCSSSRGMTRRLAPAATTSFSKASPTS